MEFEVFEEKNQDGSGQVNSRAFLAKYGIPNKQTRSFDATWDEEAQAVVFTFL